MGERVSTGSSAFDSVIEGGFPPNSLNIIMGLPGTGKTILTEGLIFANASPQEKAIYFSTVAEPLDKIVRYIQNFTFFRPEVVQDYLIFQDLSRILREEGIERTVARIAALLREHEARYAVIDSFKALRSFCSEDDFRRALQELASVATSLPLTFFWVGEYGENDTHHLRSLRWQTR